ncbi:hypothetical protein BJQ97_03103 [Geobacillus sp. TFV-3]|nr:hypothetical protein BJQ97_03103 [Geobacillus sp. TFV-3]
MLGNPAMIKMTMTKAMIKITTKTMRATTANNRVLSRQAAAERPGNRLMRAAVFLLELPTAFFPSLPAEGGTELKRALAEADSAHIPWSEPFALAERNGATHRVWETTSTYEGRPVRLIVVESSALDQRKGKLENGTGDFSAVSIRECHPVQASGWAHPTRVRETAHLRAAKDSARVGNGRKHLRVTLYGTTIYSKKRIALARRVGRKVILKNEIKNPFFLPCYPVRVRNVR